MKRDPMRPGLLEPRWNIVTIGAVLVWWNEPDDGCPSADVLMPGWELRGPGLSSFRTEEGAMAQINSDRPLPREQWKDWLLWSAVWIGGWTLGEWAEIAERNVS